MTPAVAHAIGFCEDTRERLVFARLPQCGGPLPAYFGQDDGGMCYASDQVAIHVFDAKQLAACF